MSDERRRLFAVVCLLLAVSSALGVLGGWQAPIFFTISMVVGVVMARRQARLSGNSSRKDPTS